MVHSGFCLQVLLSDVGPKILVQVRYDTRPEPGPGHQVVSKRLVMDLSPLQHAGLSPNTEAGLCWSTCPLFKTAES